MGKARSKEDLLNYGQKQISRNKYQDSTFNNTYFSVAKTKFYFLLHSGSEKISKIC
jgi:hypothetical protein